MTQINIIERQILETKDSIEFQEGLVEKNIQDLRTLLETGDTAYILKWMDSYTRRIKEAEQILDTMKKFLNTLYYMKKEVEETAA